ncbi:hypothetical protein [Actinoplanes sp. NPDC051851]|uniref:hypothetical protein n=1 Tax=Actinoplanes sp. NPDC051851 TaxID=3154753 RepID=UPI003445DE7B
MFAAPGSTAMDIAAHGRGPGTVVLPWIATTEPQTLLQYAVELTQRMSRLIALAEQVEQNKQALRQAWPTGTASDGAIEKLRAMLETFQRITTTVQNLDTQMQTVATVLQLVQQAYRSVVGSVDPTVRALLSNIHTRPAATALALSATAGLHGYVQGVRTQLDQIAFAQIATLGAALVTIAGELDTLLRTDTPRG